LYRSPLVISAQAIRASLLAFNARRIFSGRRCDEFGIDKDAINTGAGPELAQLRPQIVP
jgi:hypothetical protein